MPFNDIWHKSLHSKELTAKSGIMEMLHILRKWPKYLHSIDIPINQDKKLFDGKHW